MKNETKFWTSALVSILFVLLSGGYIPFLILAFIPALFAIRYSMICDNTE